LSIARHTLALAAPFEVSGLSSMGDSADSDG
jgi:hypothetical protein